MVRQIRPSVWSSDQLERDVERSLSDFKERRFAESHAGYISLYLSVIACMCVSCLRRAIIFRV